MSGRRRGNDDNRFTGVVELILVHSLGRDFARYLHESIRKDFREPVKQARGSAQPDS